MTKFLERRRSNPQSPQHAEGQIELTCLLFDKLLTTLLLSSIAVVGATMLLAQRYNDPWLWRLSLAMAIFWGLRVAIVMQFMKRPKEELTLQTAYKWEMLYAASILGCTACLAVSTLYNFRFHDYLAMMWCTIGVFTVMGGIGARPGMRPWVVNLCSLLLLVSLAYSLFRSPDQLVRLSVVMLLFFAYSFCSSNNCRHTNLVAQIHSRRALSALAEHDPLTGLANRRQFEARLKTVDTLSTPFAVLYLDLDGFKAINDTFGHATGDALLQAVAERLRPTIRVSDLLARLGGDEFAILQYPQASEDSARSLATRINREVATPFVIDGRRLVIGTSIGISLSTLQETDPVYLLGKADKALYRVKEAGGGNYCFAPAPHRLAHIPTLQNS